jgi:murein DD-endopeptidase MepM/ murein hydrolase activator NlpD
MSLSFKLSAARGWPTCVALALTGILGAGCSSDATRLGQNPFASPYSARETTGTAEATGSALPATPAARVESRPLPAPLPPPPPRLSMNTPQDGTVGGGRGLSPYAPNPSPEVTGSVAQTPLRPATVIKVRAGETIDTLARVHGVSAAAIRRANGLGAVSLLRVGQRLVIPRRAQQAAVAMPALPSSHTTPIPAGGNVHVVAPGETLTKIAKRYRKTLVELAAANHIPPHTKLHLGDRLTIPGAPMRTAELPQPEARPQVPNGKQADASEPAAKLRLLEEKPDTRAEGKPSNEPTGSLPGLRWPVRAKVVGPFGPTPDGQQNDGINLSVPEGTPVKAAEDGVVTYAGNAIKRYGNLVLVHHANGYTTTYAHLSELLVKRNDTVKRGQEIARSGQTGGVSKPQLHFEVRRGSTPVDPMPFLDRGG